MSKYVVDWSMRWVNLMVSRPSEIDKFKGFSNFIPLGSWCRTAWQTNLITKAADKKKISYPFDWSITRLDSIIKAIERGIIAEKILNQNDTIICPFGHVLCGHTGIRFAHDFDLKKMSEKYNFLIKKGEGLPINLDSLAEVRQARERFAYTYKNLCENLGNENTAFVRYIELSPFSDEDLYKEVYSGENPLRLLSCLKEHGAHPSSRLIYIFSELMPAKKVANKLVTRLKLSSRELFSCHIYERKGRCGDNTNHFSGDTVSWLAAITEANAWFSSF